MNCRRVLILGYFLFVLPVIGFAQSIQFADSVYKKGLELDNKGNIREANAYYGKSYHMYRQKKDTMSFLIAGFQYAKTLSRLSEYGRAMKLYKMLLGLTPAEDPWFRKNFYNSMGMTTKRMGKLDQSEDYYQQALFLGRNTQDSLFIGLVFDNMAGIYRIKGQYPKALATTQRALSLIKKHGSQKNIAKTLNDIGFIYKELSLLDKALEYYNKSLKICIQEGNIIMLSIAYNQIAGIQRKRGNYDQALIGYEKSLEFSEKAGVPRTTAKRLNNIGLLYRKLGEYDKAFNYYQQSLSIKKQIADREAIATTTHNLGKLLLEQDKFKQARSYLLQALKIREQTQNPHEIALLLTAMVRLELHLDNLPSAEQYANKLKQIGDSTGNAKIRRDASLALGNIQTHKKNHTAALIHFKKAYSYGQQLTLNKQLRPLQHIAEQFNELESDSAIFYAQKVIDIIENQRTTAGALRELKMGYFGQYSDFYKEFASWVLTYKNDVSKAFRLVELAKARSLSESLVEASKNIEQGLPEQIRVERNQQKKQIDSLYTALEIVQDPHKNSKIQGKIRTAELTYAAFENKVHLQYPQFNAPKSVQPISLKKACSLNDNRTAVLEYTIINKKLIVFFIDNEKAQVRQLSLSRKDQLAAQVRDFRHAILSESSRSQLNLVSAPIYDALIKPFRDQLDSFDNLVIVPDGPLAYLPFEALTNGSQYVVERYNIKYEPSLTILSQLRKPHASDSGRRDLLAVAGSQFSKTSSTVGASPKKSLSMLSATMIEVDSISSHFNESNKLINDKATEGRLKNMLNKNHYRYIHFATHGIIDEENPDRSGLALGSGKNMAASVKEDGLLRSSEIFGLNLNTNMVVLSACKTGLGKLMRGEGMLGLQRSFFYAGTSTMVVSVWDVYDRATALFMNDFYKAMLRDGDSGEGWTDRFLRWVGWSDAIPFGGKAVAMRKAKLKMINHSSFSHPIYWAPFIVVGR